jgi:hypothetical protein
LAIRGWGGSGRGIFAGALKYMPEEVMTKKAEKDTVSGLRRFVCAVIRCFSVSRE